MPAKSTTLAVHIEKIPRDLWHRVRVAGLHQQKTMREILVEALTDWLAKGKAA